MKRIMGLFSKSKEQKPCGEPASTTATGSDGASNRSATGREQEKMGWYQRLQEKKKEQPISDEDLEKHLGMNRKQFNTWSEKAPVGKNQPARYYPGGSAGGAGGGGGE